jgi:hypothetical protein
MAECGIARPYTGATHQGAAIFFATIMAKFLEYFQVMLIIILSKLLPMRGGYIFALITSH